MIPTCISLTTVKSEFVNSKTLLTLVGKTAGLLNFDCHLYDGDWKLTLHLCKQVNAIQMKETVEENTSTTERVFQDRQYQVKTMLCSYINICTC